jgi:hypothetical protein
MRSLGPATNGHPSRETETAATDLAGIGSTAWAMVRVRFPYGALHDLVHIGSPGRATRAADGVELEITRKTWKLAQ